MVFEQYSEFFLLIRKYLSEANTCMTLIEATHHSNCLYCKFDRFDNDVKFKSSKLYGFSDF